MKHKIQLNWITKVTQSKTQLKISIKENSKAQTKMQINCKMWSLLIYYIVQTLSHLFLGLAHYSKPFLISLKKKV